MKCRLTFEFVKEMNIISSSVKVSLKRKLLKVGRLYFSLAVFFFNILEEFLFLFISGSDAVFHGKAIFHVFMFRYRLLNV